MSPSVDSPIMVVMNEPVILSTWSFGQAANRAAWPLLVEGQSALDAAITAAMNAEDDLANHTVGTGGYPDASGQVTCDAAVMLSPFQHGAAACLHDVRHAVLVARDVMEKTPHRLLVGERAVAFARTQGHAPHRQLTDEARDAWLKWKQHQQPLLLANLEEQLSTRRTIDEAHHDTIGVIALDTQGQLAAAVTTSGLAYKMPGRVGDSPIVGSGLYCVPGIGAAVCTGRGELVQGTCLSFFAVEQLRSGASPTQAAERAIARLRESYTLHADDQVGIIVMNARGIAHGASILPGFKWAMKSHEVDRVVEC
jgi:N4-(beta-N-acetylglucosaminyl)-L-asparaginase